MSKAILVIDMPEDCTDCPLCVETVHNYGACCICGSRIISYGKFPWCPLKKMPETCIYSGNLNDEYGNGYTDGFNTCLAEMIGV